METGQERKTLDSSLSFVTSSTCGLTRFQGSYAILTAGSFGWVFTRLSYSPLGCLFGLLTVPFVPSRRRGVEGEGQRNRVSRVPRDSILFTLNLFIPHAFVIFILFVFHLLRLVQGKLYRYSPRLIENLPKARINLGFSFFICRTFIIGGFY